MLPTKSLPLLMLLTLSSASCRKAPACPIQQPRPPAQVTVTPARPPCDLPNWPSRIVLTGQKAPNGGVLTLADNPTPIVVPRGSRLLIPSDAGEVARYVNGSTAYYDRNELCRKAVRP